jgi:GAF domain
MGETARDRQVTALIARCYAGLDAAALRGEVLRRLRRIMPVDAVFFATVDPITVLFTSAVAEDPLAAARPLFMDNEFGRDDVNKFAALAESADPVSSLDRATRGDWDASPRYREIMNPLGLGDELRAALIARKRCWGVMCLHREDASHGFDVGEVDLIRRISPHVGEGLRRAISLGPAAAVASESAAPGIIVLDADLAVVSMSPEARHSSGWPRSTTSTGLVRPSSLWPFTLRPPGWSASSRTRPGRRRPPSGSGAAAGSGCPCMPQACTARPRRRSVS